MRRIRWVNIATTKRLFAEERGSGSGVFLLHGLGGTGRSLAMTLSLLERDFSLLSVDCLGHGRSSAPIDLADYAPDSLSADLLQVLDAFQHETVHLLGYGMGARLALSTTILFPERVASSILLSPVLGLAESDAGEWKRKRDAEASEKIKHGDLKTFQEALLREPEANVPNLRKSKDSKGGGSQWLKRSPIGVANSLLSLGSGSELVSREALSTSTVPTLLLSGDKDLESVNTARFLSKYLPKSEFYLLKDTGRSVHVEQTGTVTHLCRDFIRRSPMAFRKEIESDIENANS